jgi:hypothetical protein
MRQGRPTWPIGTYHVAPAVVGDEELAARLEGIVEVLVERLLVFYMHDGVPTVGKDDINPSGIMTETKTTVDFIFWRHDRKQK